MSYDRATGAVNSKRQANKKGEQKRRRTDDSDYEEDIEGSVLFDESNEDNLIDSIDGLKEEAVLPISGTIANVSFLLKSRLDIIFPAC